MSFQAYLDNIQAKTGKSRADFRAMAADKGFADAAGLTPSTKAGAIVDWLKADFEWLTATPWQSSHCSKAPKSKETDHGLYRRVRYRGAC